MTKIWIKFGCFLTGYNHGLLLNSSEASVRSVKKYMSAMIIICLLWAFIGYSFSKRYMHADTVWAVVASIAMVVVIIQIERQIILTSGSNLGGKIFRVLIALVMAVIGSIIIDQIIFKDDVEKNKINNVQNNVESILLTKTRQLDNEIDNLEKLVNLKESERSQLQEEISRKPLIKSATSERRNYTKRITTADGQVRDTIVTKTDMSLSDISNPKQLLLAPLDKQIEDLRKQKLAKESSRFTIRQDLEKELLSKTGILDELTILFSILTASGAAMFVWICFFIFFLAIELFVLMSKAADQTNDYDKLLVHQMEIRMKVLDKLNTE